MFKLLPTFISSYFKTYADVDRLHYDSNRQAVTSDTIKLQNGLGPMGCAEFIIEKLVGEGGQARALQCYNKKEKKSYLLKVFDCKLTKHMPSKQE